MEQRYYDSPWQRVTKETRLRVYAAMWRLPADHMGSLCWVPTDSPAIGLCNSRLMHASA
ncbi:hypothetical protein INR49_008592 [Caranx melampygus]|nr:hypothetical protein INR49_008592 [Caranx melampygus]